VKIIECFGMDNMVSMFWHNLNKEILSQNLNKGTDFFSLCKTDYSFIRKEKNIENILKISFYDKKNDEQIDINVKVID
jgi:hypothetical protein